VANVEQAEVHRNGPVEVEEERGLRPIDPAVDVRPIDQR
jgi:hypothetical protein